MKRYCLTVTLVEDLHSGSGLGNLWIDALLARDRYGRPVIRASHFKGVLRDNARLRLSVPDKQLRALFGAPRDRRSALQLTSLYCRTDDLNLLIWSSASRREGSRVPERDKLFTREFIPANTQFTGELQLADDQLAHWLERSFEVTDCLGARRSRGNGLITLDWTEQTLPANASSADWKIPPEATGLRLRLRAREALVLPRTGYPGNLIPSESFIRGRTLWGALGQYALATGQDALADLIFDRRIRVGDALPLPEAATRETAPLAGWQVRSFPLYLNGKKPGGNTADLQWPWWAYPESTGQWLDVRDCFDMLVDLKETPEDKPKRPGAHEYLWRAAPGLPFHRYRCEPRVQLRNAVPKQPDEDTRLFSNEEIHEDTGFLVDIECPEHPTLEKLVKGLTPVLRHGVWLGIGRGGRPVQVDQDGWAFLTPQPPPAPANDGFRLVLTSDLVARTEELNFATELTPTLLARLAGLPSAELKLTHKPPPPLCETEILRGFNGETGLPAAPMVAIRRGSAIAINGDDAPKLAAALAACPQLGERAWAGLGRFVLEPDYPLPESKNTSADQAPVLENWREDLLAKVDDFLTAHAKTLEDAKTRPSKSQWQALRTRAIACQTEDHWTKLWNDLAQAATETLGQRVWQTIREPLQQGASKIKALSHRQIFMDRLIRKILRNHYNTTR